MPENHYVSRTLLQLMEETLASYEALIQQYPETREAAEQQIADLQSRIKKLRDDPIKTTF